VAVTPDRSTVYAAIPSKDWVAVVDVLTNNVAFLTLPAGSGPRGVAVAPDPSAVSSPLAIDAVDDVVASPLPALGVGPAVSNVLANDTLGGRPAAVGNVTLSTKSSTSPSITLDASTGAVSIGADTAAGSHVLTYEICETSHASNCDQAAVKLTVRDPYAIVANSDSAKSFAGATPIANVLANDLFNGGVPDLTSVALSSVPSGDPSVVLNVGDGSVSVAADAAVGDHSVSYRICEIASPTNCAESTATITVLAHSLFAASYSASVSRSGGIAVANVLANDTFDGAAATFARVTLSQVSSTSDGVALNAATGAVLVASGTATGVQTLPYKICETASPSNCAGGTVTVNVTSFVINAVADQARASNKTASTPIANVLANDTLGGAPATLKNVSLSLASPPPTRLVQLDTSTGAVNILGKVSGGTISFAYQICEVGNPTNCSRATVTLDLSGK
jgi:hypothetical protein